MDEIRLPYGRTGFWFVRMPCYFRPVAHGRQVRLQIVSRNTDREIGLAMNKRDMPGSMDVFVRLTEIFSHRDDPGYEGILERFGEHALVLCGVVAAVHGGQEVIDVNVKGGAVTVESC